MLSQSSNHSNTSENYNIDLSTLPFIKRRNTDVLLSKIHAHEYLDYHIIRVKYDDNNNLQGISTDYIPSRQTIQLNDYQCEKPVVIFDDDENVNVKSSFTPEMNYNVSYDSPIIDFIGNPTDASNFFNGDLNNIQFDFADLAPSVPVVINNNNDLIATRVELP